MKPHLIWGSARVGELGRTVNPLLYKLSRFKSYLPHHITEDKLYKRNVDLVGRYWIEKTNLDIALIV